MQEKVSIIIPTFNRADTIKQSVESVLNQTYTNIEVIIVDDGSIDNTKNIIDSINDKRVLYIYQEKKGANAARNLGVDYASADIIAFQDSDDVWHDDKLEKQIEFMKTNNLDFCSSAFDYHINNTVYQKCGVDIPSNREDVWCMLLEENFISTQTIILYKYCFEKVSFDNDIKRLQDYDFALQIINHYNIGHICESLVDVYYMPDSITSNFDNDKSLLLILNKHEADIHSKKMECMYHYAKGRIIRKSDTKDAAREYWKSFCCMPSFKRLLLAFLCYLKLIKLYDYFKLL